MREPVTISPMALYYLGTRMKAKYIGYAYIAAMPDIQKRYAVHEAETLEQLEKDGYIEQDFQGNVKISDQVREALTPVFFAAVESRVHGRKDYRFHVHSSGITAAVAVPGANGRIACFSFYPVGEEDIPFFLKMAAGRDTEVAIQCADVAYGYRDGTFSGEELREPDGRRRAVDLIMGVRKEHED